MYNTLCHIILLVVLSYLILYYLYVLLVPTIVHHVVVGFVGLLTGIQLVTLKTYRK